MDCLEFRRRRATEPASQDPALTGHEAKCSSCAAFSVEMESVDQLLDEALRLPVPPALANFSLSETDQPAPRRFGLRIAMAASVLAAIAVSFGAWQAATAPTIGGELVAHIRHEPKALMPVAEPVSVDAVDFVLQQTGARLEAPLGTITYIKTCPFRNQQVAHIVIEGSTGPVTLMLLPDIEVEAATPIDEEGYKGTIVPVGKGSVAIIGGETEPLEPVEQLVSSAVAWQI